MPRVETWIVGAPRKCQWWIKCCRGDYWTLLFYSGVVPLKKSSKYDHVLKISSQKTQWCSQILIWIYNFRKITGSYFQSHVWLVMAPLWWALTCTLGLFGQLVLRCWASLNMVQTSIHRWGFFFPFWNIQKIVGERIYITTKGTFVRPYFY